MPLQMSSAVRYSYDDTTNTYTKQVGTFDDSGWTYDDETGTTDDNVASVGEDLTQDPDFSFENYVGFVSFDVGGTPVTFMVTNYFVGFSSSPQDAPFQWLETTESGLSEADYPDTFNQSEITFGDFPEPLCFAVGTRIATPNGEAPVEALRAGDVVLNSSHHELRVLWVGRQTLHRFQPGASRRLVRINAGALGDGLPTRDLTVTADHGIVIDGLVITAGALVNGGTIDWIALTALSEQFTVYHIETEAHEAVLANGVPSETFIDNVSRTHFDNYDDYLALYGADRIIPKMPAPRISATRLIPDHIKARLGISMESTGDMESVA